jgi:hypothetical protein
MRFEMNGRARFGLLAVLFSTCGASCAARDSATDTVVASPDEATTLVSSAHALTRVERVRSRFRLIERDTLTGHATPQRGASAIARGVATGFVPARGPLATTHVTARLPASALRMPRPAHVLLPRRANDAMVLEDATSQLQVRVGLRGASEVEATFANGYALYAEALEGADVIQRVHAEGTEDFIVFERKPVREELVYDVDVSAVPGVRLVGNSLELLDRSGTPALRIAPPYVVDAEGAAHPAKLEIEGCAFDTNPAPPWGRVPTAPKSKTCTVHVSWSGTSYPLLVDPAWTGTGNLGTGRHFHAATLLTSGKVLIAGGTKPDYADTASAELYDPATGTFGATGSMATSRSRFGATLLKSGNVLVTAGNGPNGAWDLDPIGTAELYDEATGKFTATGSLQKKRVDPTATMLASGKVLVVGGFDLVNTGPEAELYDPDTGTFGSTGAPAFHRWRHTATLLSSGKVLLAGGDAGYATGQINEIYDPAGAGSFVATGKMTTPRSWHTATPLPTGEVLVAGGFQDAFLMVVDSAEVFDPAALGGVGQFRLTGAMTVSRFGASASLLPGGLVLVAGGRTKVASPPSTTPSDKADLYNATNGTFVAENAMTLARAFHTATLLQSSVLLVTGGQSSPVDDVTNRAELYNACTGNAQCSAGYQCLAGACLPTSSSSSGGSSGTSGNVGDAGDTGGEENQAGDAGSSGTSSGASSGDGTSSSGSGTNGDGGGATTCTVTCVGTSPAPFFRFGAVFGAVALLSARRRRRAA